jgi:ABC-type transporter Mla maintaining outer membrane lipid asymmetry ATPase subunit MlaF
MPAADSPVLQMTGVEKRYHALRPLRLADLTVARAERVALVGVDGGMAEVIVNLVTGAGVPDRGDVRVLGQSTRDIAGGEDWLASLDRFGIVSDRAILLEGSTVAQNLAMPFTLQVDPVSPEIATRVETLAAACGIAESFLPRFVGDVPADVRARAHLARAVALDPSLLILEHATAGLPASSVAGFADDVVRVTGSRTLAVLVLTLDEAFATRVAHRALKLRPADGSLQPLGKRRWF